jgi:DNA-binding transcriptional MerR regulator
MPDNKKIYYSIGEVCLMTGLESHVLRYWETEFPLLRPKKNRAGNRAYRDKDIEIIRFIKHLLYEEQYTILGAKRKCAEAKDNMRQTELTLDQPTSSAAMRPIKQELRDLLQTLLEL